MSEIIRSAISAIIDSIINLVAAKKSQERKEQRADAIEAKKEQKEIFQTRPEMSIVEWKNYLSRPGYGIKQKCDIELFVAHIDSVTVEGNGKRGRKKREHVLAHYSSDNLNLKEWCCVIYTLKNAGKTDVSTTDIICNYKRDTCIFDCDAIEWCVVNNVLNYSKCYDRKIRCGEKITLKLCYHKDRIISGMFSAVMAIGMKDDNGRCWRQPLFAPEDKVYDSRQVTWKEYREELRPDSAIECFKQPWLW